MSSGSRTGTETSDAPPAGVLTVSLTMPPGAASMLGRVTGAVPATPESRVCLSAGAWASTESPAAPAAKLMVTGWALVLTTIPDRVPRNPEHVAGLRRRSFTRGSLPAALVDDATTDIVLSDYVKRQVGPSAIHAHYPAVNTAKGTKMGVLHRPDLQKRPVVGPVIPARRAILEVAKGEQHTWRSRSARRLFTRTTVRL